MTALTLDEIRAAHDKLPTPIFRAAVAMFDAAEAYRAAQTVAIHSREGRDDARWAGVELDRTLRLFAEAIRA